MLIDILNEKRKRDKYVILTGGTGLYIDSITEGLSDLPAGDTDERGIYAKKF